MAPTSAMFLLGAATVLLGALALTKKRELVHYVDLEHINLTYWNPKYYKYVKVSTVRYSRKDPTYYLNVHGETLVTFGNNVTVYCLEDMVSDTVCVEKCLKNFMCCLAPSKIDAYIYEFLSNEYRRSFVEVHLGFCDLLFNDKVLSPFLNKLYPRCPVPPGPYAFENLTVPNHPVLKTFPFTKGRFYGSVKVRDTGERLCDVYVDAAIKQRLKN